MRSLWQSPGGLIDWFSEVYPDAQASYLWIGPNTVEIRVWKIYREERRILWLDPYGKWNEVEENTWSPPSKVLDREEAERMQIKELEPGIHTLCYNMDKCLACKIPGYVHNTLQTECPGWIE